MISKLKEMMGVVVAVGNLCSCVEFETLKSA